MHDVLKRLGCVCVVAVLIFPFGQHLFPVMASLIGHLQFAALEAVVAAAVGHSLYATLFG